MSARPRIAVPRELFDIETMSGRGRMWHEVLTRLPAHFRLVRPRRPTLSLSLPRPTAAWLSDGHNGPLPTELPQVIQLHEAPWSEPETLATLEPEFLAQVVGPSRTASHRAAAIVCPSQSSKRQIVADAGIPEDRVFVAHHGIDHAVFRPAADARPTPAFGIDPDRPYILTVAALHPRKNLVALRDAVGLLAKDGHPHQLVIVEGPSHGRSDGDILRERIAADLPHARDLVVSITHGIADADVAALMRGAAAFCLPSLSEGFGLPAAEAMACGAPTVLSNRGALPEVADGAAVLVEPTTDNIARGLASILDSPSFAAELSAKGIQRAREFTWDRCAEQWSTAIAAGIRRGAP